MLTNYPKAQSRYRSLVQVNHSSLYEKNFRCRVDCFFFQDLHFDPTVDTSTMSLSRRLESIKPVLTRTTSKLGNDPNGHIINWFMFSHFPSCCLNGNKTHSFTSTYFPSFRYSFNHFRIPRKWKKISRSTSVESSSPTG